MVLEGKDYQLRIPQRYSLTPIVRLESGLDGNRILRISLLECDYSREVPLVPNGAAAHSSMLSETWDCESDSRSSRQTPLGSSFCPTVETVRKRCQLRRIVSRLMKTTPGATLLLGRTGVNINMVRRVVHPGRIKARRFSSRSGPLLLLF